jgi:hypothetical protein
MSNLNAKRSASCPSECWNKIDQSERKNNLPIFGKNRVMWLKNKGDEDEVRTIDMDHCGIVSHLERSLCQCVRGRADHPSDTASWVTCDVIRLEMDEEKG